MFLNNTLDIQKSGDANLPYALIPFAEMEKQDMTCFRRTEDILRGLLNVNLQPSAVYNPPQGAVNFGTSPTGPLPRVTSPVFVPRTTSPVGMVPRTTSPTGFDPMSTSPPNRNTPMRTSPVPNDGPDTLNLRPYNFPFHQPLLHPFPQHIIQTTLSAPHSPNRTINDPNPPLPNDHFSLNTSDSNIYPIALPTNTLTNNNNNINNNNFNANDNNGNNDNSYPEPISPSSPLSPHYTSSNAPTPPILAIPDSPPSPFLQHTQPTTPNLQMDPDMDNDLNMDTTESLPNDKIS